MLTREIITRAAVELADEVGAPGLTMNRLAKRLEVRPSALYNHADSKATVLGWVLEEVNGAIDVDCFGDGWRTGLERWARSYRKAYARHPMLAPLMAVQGVADAPVTLAMYERVAQALVDGGFTPSDAVEVIVAVESFVFGSILDLAAAEDIFEPGAASHLAPVFAAGARERLASAGGARGASDSSFERGLAALVAGLDASH